MLSHEKMEAIAKKMAKKFIPNDYALEFDDIIQECVIHLHYTLEKVSPEHPEKYGWVITKNHALKLCKQPKRAITTVRLEEYSSVVTSLPSVEFDNEPSLEAKMKVIMENELTPVQRLIIQMVFWQNMSLSEVKQEFGPNAHNLFYRSLARLRRVKHLLRD